MSLFLPDKEDACYWGRKEDIVKGCGEERTRLATVCGFFAKLIDMEREWDAPDQHMKIFREEANILVVHGKEGNDLGEIRWNM